MTRAEFDVGWNTLKGAGLRGAIGADPDVYYSAIEDLSPSLWTATVGRMVRVLDDAWFPAAGEIFPHVAAVAREMAAAEKEARRAKSKLGCDPKTGEPFVDQHPALARHPGEGHFAYIQRLAVKLGYEVAPGAPFGKPMPAAREIRLPYKDSDDEAWEAL